MTKLTYRDYINYLKAKFSSYQESELSPEDVRLYYTIKDRLERASSLPDYILQASLLDSVDLDEDALKAVANIKAAIALGKMSSNPLSLLREKMNRLFFAQLKISDFIGVAAAFLFISIFSFLAFIGLYSGSEAGTIPLFGVAGGQGVGTFTVNPFVFINVGVVCAFLALLFLIAGKRK